MTRSLGPYDPLDLAPTLGTAAICLLPVGYVTATWMAGRVASWITGHGWSGPALDLTYAVGWHPPAGSAALGPAFPFGSLCHERRRDRPGCRVHRADHLALVARAGGGRRRSLAGPLG